ncbi:MAG: hypothetical protein QNJ92_06415 [Alphaproteobacteria bacterium]|nr:hypothetical protein [Alphaproteobacteria bacterium]
MANDLVIAANLTNQALALARTAAVSSARRPAAPNDAGRHRTTYLELEDDLAVHGDKPTVVDPVFGREARSGRPNAAFVAQLIAQQDRSPRLSIDQTRAATQTYERAGGAGAAANGVDLTI